MTKKVSSGNAVASSHTVQLRRSQRSSSQADKSLPINLTSKCIKKNKRSKIKGIVKSPAANAGDGGFLLSLLTEDSWAMQLNTECQKEYFTQLQRDLDNEYSDKTLEIFPPKHQIFNAFNMTPFSKVKVVIIGQDPYHDNGQAHGLSFSVAKGTELPATLKNIFKELSSDITEFVMPTHGCLEKWAKDGVLLLNSILTVRAHEPNSHSRLGWQAFTDAAISALSHRSGPGCVFVLWGKTAQSKQSLIDTSKHRVICTAHPSPQTLGKFKGCRCFSRTNEELVGLGHTPVDWSII